MAKMLVCKKCGRKYTLCNAKYNMSVLGNSPSWRTDYCDVPCYQEYIKEVIAKEEKQAKPKKTPKVVKKSIDLKETKSKIVDANDDFMYDKV